MQEMRGSRKAPYFNYKGEFKMCSDNPNVISIYGKEDCAACSQAKMILDGKGIAYAYKQLDEDYSMEDLMDVCATYDLPLPRSFPMVIGTVDSSVQQLTLVQLKGL